jgi:hypothetical protein
MTKPRKATPRRVRKLKRDDQSGVSVYDGQTALGTVQRQRGGYVAVTPEGRVLGSYRTQQAAADALTRRAAR